MRPLFNRRLRHKHRYRLLLLHRHSLRQLAEQASRLQLKHPFSRLRFTNHLRRLADPQLTLIRLVMRSLVP